MTQRLAKLSEVPAIATAAQGVGVSDTVAASPQAVAAQRGIAAFPAHYSSTSLYALSLTTHTTATPNAGASGTIRLNTSTNTSQSGILSFVYLPPGGFANNVTPFSRAAVFAAKFVVTAGTSGSFAARLLVGKASSPSVGALATHGFGFNVDSTLALFGVAHDGTTLDTVDLSTTISINVVYDLVAVSDGDGNIDFYVNGSLAGTSNGGPTANVTNRVASVEIANDGTATASIADFGIPAVVFS
jgi:hypothetical protein